MRNAIYLPLLLSLLLMKITSGQCFGTLPASNKVAYAATIESQGEASKDSLEISEGWVQEGPPSNTITAAFMVIENHSHADVALESVSTEAANVVEMHMMELTDGIMKMKRIDSIDIPAGGRVELKPGGYHLMVIGLKKELKEGGSVTFILRFSHDIRKTITIPVKPRSSIENF